MIYHLPFKIFLIDDLPFMDTLCKDGVVKTLRALGIMNKAFIYRPTSGSTSPPDKAPGGRSAVRYK